MTHRDFVFTFAALAASSAGTTQIPYSVTDLCAPAICVEGPPVFSCPVLNDNGAIAGTTSSGTFVLYPGQGMINVNQQTGFAGFLPEWMNNQGVIAGDGMVDSQYAALVYVPGGLLLYLNPVFGWLEGFASYINDMNVITASGENPSIPCAGQYFVPGIACASPLRITDTGIVVGEDENARIFVYSPLTGITYLTGMAIGFNDIGHVVTEVYIGGPSTYTYLPYTPAQGEVTLPLPLIGLSGGSGNVYLNNSDQMVFTTALGVPSFYSAATGLLPLTSLVAADSGWGFIDVYAINNRGQILAEGVNAAAGRTTFVLLTPAGPPPFIYTADAVEAPAPAIEAEGQGRLQWRDCTFAALNNVRLGAGLCSKRSPDR